MGYRARLGLALMLSLAVTTAASAQGVQTGTIRGVVSTPDGLPAPGVTVTAKSPSLQGERTAVSQAPEGTYEFTALPPGTYTLTFELSGAGTQTETALVPLGGVAKVDVVLKPASLTAEVTVRGEAPTVLTTPTVGANIRHDEVEALAAPRTLVGIASLAPALTENTPNQGQVTINGAFAYDNSFMVNGVDINDNLFGSPQNLFIEDAIQETQVLTSGISAEYGRFSGGVVNAITKSGGNAFSGSYRLNFTNPSWTVETPLEKENGTTRDSKLNKVHEATLGGPIMRDRLWFFSAGRLSNIARTDSFDITTIPYTTTTKNKRGEAKLTGTVANNHTISGSYINNSTDDTNLPTFGFSLTPSTFLNDSQPNRLFVGNYRGVLSSNLLAEVQYSERRFGFRNSGGTSKNIFDSPFITLTQTLGEYNAPYFDSTDPEDRNNRQLTGNVSYFFSAAGRHELKSGWEWYRSQRKGGNSQSATDYVFIADYATDVEGNPALDANQQLQPVFTRGRTQLQHWLAVRGATMNIDQNSLFAQDHWTISPKLSADVGLRYEKVRSKATGNIIGVDTDTIVPRLAAAYDLNGDGQTVFHATYGHYAGRYNDVQIGANNNVGNPSLLIGIYTGPSGQGVGYAPGFDPANYTTVFGSFPTANVFITPGLSSPITKEFTLSAGNQLGRKGAVQATYVWRNTDNFIEDFIDLGEGTTHVVQNGVDAGTFTNVKYRNNNVADRQFQSLVFQGRYTATRRLTVAGNWTVQLKNDGNFVGEGTNQPGSTSVIGDYPEIREAAVHYPSGRLPDLQRHKMRAWAIYNFDLHHAGGLSVSGLWRFDSGQTFSYRATGVDLTAQQTAILDSLGYPDAPSSQTIYFGGRGTGSFPSNRPGLVDMSVNYDVPVFRSARPWVKLDLFNVFNNQRLIAFDTTVEPDPTSAVDALGIPSGFVKADTFGKPISNTNYPVPFTGLTGGRSFRMAVGFRF